jgi:hypothetical protein
MNKAVIRDLITGTLMPWYLGELSGTILRSCSGHSGTSRPSTFNHPKITTHI